VFIVRGMFVICAADESHWLQGVAGHVAVQPHSVTPSIRCGPRRMHGYLNRIKWYNNYPTVGAISARDVSKRGFFASAEPNRTEPNQLFNYCFIVIFT